MKLLPLFGLVGVLLANVIERVPTDDAQRGAQNRPVRLRPVRTDASPRCTQNCDEAANTCLSRCPVSSPRHCMHECVTVQVECLAQCPDAGIFPTDGAPILGNTAPQPVVRTVPRRRR